MVQPAENIEAMNEQPRPLHAHRWPRDDEGWYVEPRWCSERLFAVEKFEGPILDPACGLGRIVEAAIKAGHLARGSDIVKRSPICEVRADFLEGNILGPANIVCNPPFSTPRCADLAQRFVERALRIAAGKVAMLLPAKWLFGDERSRWLEKTPLAKIWLLTPRPSIPPGDLIEAGGLATGGREDFAWLVWEPGYVFAPALMWLRKDRR
jgi:hypothetical protein